MCVCVCACVWVVMHACVCEQLPEAGWFHLKYWCVTGLAVSDSQFSWPGGKIHIFLFPSLVEAANFISFKTYPALWGFVKARDVCVNSCQKQADFIWNTDASPAWQSATASLADQRAKYTPFFFLLWLRQPTSSVSRLKLHFGGLQERERETYAALWGFVGGGGEEEKGRTTCIISPGLASNYSNNCRQGI